MRKSYKFARRPKIEAPRFRVNHLIKTETVSLIDETGAFLGPTPLAKALTLALERGYDLVEVGPKANPPVAKILNFGQFQYEQGKMQRKQKAHQKKNETKGLRLSLKIGQHDIDVRVKQAREFMEEGNKVKIEIMLRGREMQHADLARGVLNDFINQLGVPITIDQPITRQGNKISIIIMSGKE